MACPFRVQTSATPTNLLLKSAMWSVATSLNTTTSGTSRSAPTSVGACPNCSGCDSLPTGTNFTTESTPSDNSDSDDEWWYSDSDKSRKLPGPYATESPSQLAGRFNAGKRGLPWRGKHQDFEERMERWSAPDNTELFEILSELTIYGYDKFNLALGARTGCIEIRKSISEWVWSKMNPSSGDSTIDPHQRPPLVSLPLGELLNVPFTKRKTKTVLDACSEYAASVQQTRSSTSCIMQTAKRRLSGVISAISTAVGWHPSADPSKTRESRFTDSLSANQSTATGPVDGGSSWAPWKVALGATAGLAGLSALALTAQRWYCSHGDE